VFKRWSEWVQLDLQKDRASINRKVFHVVLWCLLIPGIISFALLTLRKLHLLAQIRFYDAFTILPALGYTLFTLWPTLKRLPGTFRKGAAGAVLEDSLVEVEWAESTRKRMQSELNFTSEEWKGLNFYLQVQLKRAEDQNRYMSILSGVVLLLMFQFLDAGMTSEIPLEQGPTGLIRMWVESFSQWGVQLISLALFSTLFYLSGLQVSRHLNRYRTCVERMIQS
jgi:hypothetical protein